MSSLTIGGTLAGQTTTDQETVTPFAGVAITDDPGQTETVTVTLSSSANGTLSNVGHGSYDAATGVYTDTGSANAVTADLEGLIFTPAQGTPGLTVTTTFAISDTDTANATATDHTTTVITTSGPAISGTQSGQLTTDQASVNPFFGVTITDDPGQTENVTVTLSSPTNGTLFQTGDGNYDADTGVYTVSGTAATVTADLAELVFTPAQGTPGHSVTTAFTISDTDAANVTTTDTSTSVVATAGPSIAGTYGGQMTSDQSTVTPFATVVITDDPGQIETVQVALSSPANGMLTTDGNGSYDATSGIYTDTGSASAVTADLNALVFTPSQGMPGQTVTTTFTITDTDTAGVSATPDSNTTVLVSSGPTISGTQGGQQTANQTAILPFAGVTIADDAGQNESISVTLSSAANGTLTNLGLGTYNAATGVFTDSGSAPSVTNDLDHLVFTPSQGTPGQSVTTTFTISDTDSANVSVSDNTTSVTAVTGPVISGTTAYQPTTDQTTVLAFAGVTISDSAGQTEAVTVTLSAAGNGTLSNLGNGSYNAQTGVYTDTGSAAAVTTDLDQLIFTPAAGTPGQGVTTTFTISDTDTANVTATDNTTSVVATSGPSITGAAGGQTAINQSPVTPFSQVIITDDAAQVETVTVTLSSAANGTLTNLGGGTYDAVNGIYTDTGSASAVTADLNGLVFNPVGGTPGQAVTTTFLISDTDSANASVSDDTTSVVDIAGPSITGTVAGQTTTDQATVTPFANVVITDDPSQTDTLTVTLSNAANGTITNVGNGTYDAVNGIWTDTGSASAVTSDLQALTFTPSQGTPGANTTTVFTIHDTDTVDASATDNTTSVIAASGPAISGTEAGQTVSDEGTINPFANVVITDAQGQNEVVSVTLSNWLNGSLSNLGSGSYDVVNGFYTDSGSAAAVTADLRGLVFTPNPGTPGQGATTTTFTISDTDTASITATDSRTTVLAESGPAISGTVADQTATDTGTIQPFAGVAIADDPGQTETVTVSFAPGNGVLTNLGNGSYNAPAGQYTDTGTAAAVTADLEALVFTPVHGTSGQDAVTTTFTIADTDSAGLSATDTTTSVVTQSGPAISGAQAGQATTDLVAVTPFANLTIADDPSQTETVTVTLSSPANGTLSDSIEGSYNATTGVFTVTDSAPAVTTVLDALVFTPALGIPGHSAVTTTFTVRAADTAGLSATNNTTTVVTQSGPAISGTSANQNFADTGTIAPFAHMTIADDASQTETVTVTVSAPANGTLSHLGGGSYNSTTGVYTVSGSASAVTSALQSLAFTPVEMAAGHSAVTTGFTVSTTDTAGLGATDTTTSVVAQAGPAISGTSAGQGVVDTGTITPFAHVTVADDASQTETVTVTLSNPANGTLSHLGSGTYNSTAGVYTVSGSASAVTSALDSLVFTPAQGTPGHSAVATTFAIHDIDTVGMTAVDSATSVVAQSGPAISGTSAGQSVAGTGTIAPFAHVTIADDVSQTETVTVTLSNPANGTLSHLGSGSYNGTTGVYTVSGSASAVTSALDSLVFTPAQGTPGHSAVTTTFAISDADTAGLSATDTTTSVAAQSGPAISGASAGQSIADTGTIAPFAHLTIADDVSQTETVTVTLSNPANGTLRHLSGGSYNSSTGTYTVSGSASVVTSDLDALLFVPVDGTAGTGVTTTFSISDADTAGLTASNSTTSVIAIGGPAIAGTSGGQPISNGGTVHPFSAVSITDAVGQMETVTVTLSTTSNGTLSNLGNGSYNAETGIYTDTGSAAAVTSDLGGLVFTSSQPQLTVGHTISTGITLSVSDSAQLGASDGTTSIVQDGTTPVGGIPDNFTGNGTSDVLFENSNSGLVLYWQIQNDSVQQSVAVAGASAGWNLVGTGDFTGNGVSDVLFQNSDSGLVLYWELQNGVLQASVPIAGASAGWNLIGTGDFNGDGTDDILFQNSDSGLVLDWQMQNGAFQTSVPIAGASAGWNFIGTGDFNGDGTDDILFQNSDSGLVLFWQMHNGALQASVPIAGATPDWQYVGVGDVTGDGTDDILFVNKNSDALLDWQLTNGALSGGGIIGTLPAGYQFAGVGSYSGTSTSDILLHNPTSGSYLEWKMADGSLSQVIPLGGAGSDWKMMG